jgi:hypothetical protein
MVLIMIIIIVGLVRRLALAKNCQWYHLLDLSHLSVTLPILHQRRVADFGSLLSFLGKSPDNLEVFSIDTRDSCVVKQNEGNIATLK